MTALDLWFVVVNCPSKTVAEAIGRGALQSGLTKNVNISAPMTTLYVWDERVVENQEVQLIFKILGANVAGLTALVKEHHPFQTASIVAWRIDHTTPDYGEFIRAT